MKLHKLLMTTTAIASVLGGNMNIAQAQSLPAHCTGAAIGALILAIGGNARAADNAIPAECGSCVLSVINLLKNKLETLDWLR